MKARVWIRDRDYRDALAVAWHNAMLARAVRMPRLKDLMPPPLDDHGRRSRRKQFETPAQEWAMWEAIVTHANAAHAERKRRGLDN